MEFTAKQIAEMIGGRVEGNENAAINSFAKIEEGKPGAISFLSNPKYTHYLYETQSSVVLINEDVELEQPVAATLIRVKNAYESVAKLLQLYESMKPRKTGIEPQTYISEKATIGKDCYIGAFAYVGDGFHDADMFDNADIGIALNAMGDEQAEDAADVILMDDDIMRVPAIMRIVSDVSRLIQENLVLLGASKLLLLILALSGLLSLLPAALLHTLCCCLACLNSLRSFTID